DREEASGSGQARLAPRCLGPRTRARLLRRGIADDARQLRRRFGLYAHGMGVPRRLESLVRTGGPAALPRDGGAVLLPAQRDVRRTVARGPSRPKAADATA